ncbi:hypothetical protein H1Q63_21695 [Desmonostoc muscorum CCALA 125]|nr:hypothetical protein [Desmonostoc muscorum CCALA 125]
MTTNLPVLTEIVPIVLQLQPAIALTDDQFYDWQGNDDLGTHSFCKYFSLFSLANG